MWFTEFMGNFSGIDFITSDTHWGHANCIKFDNRPFATVEEMDLALIENWNSKVKDRNKDVFHLGDFAFRNKHPIHWYTSRLYGRIHLIFGNHDDKGARRHPELFSSTHEALYLRFNNYKITMSHYGHRTWRSAHHGAWMLYGHSHGKLPSYGRSLDVGCMLHGYAPLSFKELKEKMLALPMRCPDHGECQDEA